MSTSNCNICFGSLKGPQANACIANHPFHEKCLHQWIDTCKQNERTPGCPLCRRTILHLNHSERKYSEKSSVALSDLSSKVASLSSPFVKQEERFSSSLRAQSSFCSFDFPGSVRSGQELYLAGKQFESALILGDYEEAGRLLKNRDLPRAALEIALVKCIKKGPKAFSVVLEIIYHPSVSSFAKNRAYEIAREMGYDDLAAEIEKEGSIYPFILLM